MDFKTKIWAMESELCQQSPKGVRYSRRNGFENLHLIESLSGIYLDKKMNSTLSFCNIFMQFLWERYYKANNEEEDEIEGLLNGVNEDMGGIFFELFPHVAKAIDERQAALVLSDYSKTSCRILDHAEEEVSKISYELKKLEKEWFRINEEIHNLQEVIRKTEEKKKRILDNGECYVYFMKTSYGSNVKIGISNHPEKREKTLRSDEDLFLYSTCKFPSRKEALKAEKMLHNYFKQYKTRGEWFDLPYCIYSERDLSSLIKEIKQKTKEK